MLGRTILSRLAVALQEPAYLYGVAWTRWVIRAILREKSSLIMRRQPEQHSAASPYNMAGNPSRQQQARPLGGSARDRANYPHVPSWTLLLRAGVRAAVWAPPVVSKPLLRAPSGCCGGRAPDIFSQVSSSTHSQRLLLRQLARGGRLQDFVEAAGTTGSCGRQ